MKTIEQLKEEQRQQLKTLEREHALAASLPLPPHRVMVVKGAPWVTYKVKGLAGALAVFSRLPVVPAWAAVNGCRVVEPLETMAARYQDHIDSGPWAVWLDVETRTNGPGGTTGKLTFYSRTTAGDVVRVICDVEGPGYIGAYGALSGTFNETRSPRGRVVRSRDFSANPRLNGYSDRVFSWATGDMGPVKTRGHHWYAWAADDDAETATGEECTHAAAMLRNLAGELEPETARDDSTKD